MSVRDIAVRAAGSSHKDMFTNVTNGPVKTVSKTTSAICNRWRTRCHPTTKYCMHSVISEPLRIPGTLIRPRYTFWTRFAYSSSVRDAVTWKISSGIAHSVATGSTRSGTIRSGICYRIFAIRDPGSKRSSELLTTMKNSILISSWTEPSCWNGDPNWLWMVKRSCAWMSNILNLPMTSHFSRFHSVSYPVLSIYLLPNRGTPLFQYGKNFNNVGPIRDVSYYGVNEISDSEIPRGENFSTGMNVKRPKS